MKNFKHPNKQFARFAALMIVPLLAACAPETTTTTTTVETPTASPTLEATPPTPTTPTTSPTVGEGNDLVNTLSNNDSFRTFREVITATGLTQTLQTQQPHTVFVPTEEAFTNVPQATRQRLLQPENRELLTRILRYHIVPGQLTSNQLQSGTINTLEGNPVNINVNRADNQVTVNGARVTQPDIQASNGVIHGIDRVILPPNLQL